MNAQEIFDTIINVCADSCNVSVDSILNSCTSKDVVKARSICMLWLDAMQFDTVEVMKYANKPNANSINSVRDRIEDLWRDCPMYRMLVRDTRDRLKVIADSIGEQFDFEKPIRHLQKITGKY